MSCDAELQELMAQVDKMVENQRLELQEKIKITETKLNTSLQENYGLKIIIEEKQRNIDNLKNKLKLKENFPSCIEFDQDVLQLKSELSEMKTNYEKYKSKCLKKEKQIEKDKEQLYKEKLELVKQLSELKKYQNQWMEDKNRLEDQIGDMNREKSQTFSEKEMISGQLKSMKLELSKQIDSWYNTEQNYKQRLKDLEDKLETSKVSFQKEVEQNRSEFCELMKQTKKALDEKQQLIVYNESSKRMVERLENELSRVTTENKMNEKKIYKLEQIVKMSEKTINEKTEIIKAFQMSSPHKDYANQLTKLENELFEAKSDLKLSKKSEKSLQGNIEKLEVQLKEFREFNETQENQRKEAEKSINHVFQLEERNQKLLTETKKLECTIKSKDLELERIKQKLEKLEGESKEKKSPVLDVVLSSNQENKHTQKKLSDNKNCSGDHQESLSTPHFEKEVNSLLKMCGEKDLVIQRLQMENRILQDFICKLNASMSDGEFLNPELRFDSFTTNADSFYPLKETFSEVDLKNVKELPENVFDCNSRFQSLANSFSNNKTSSNLDGSVHKSSEDFLSLLSHKEHFTDNRIGTNSFLNALPTLSAAKYFNDEREKARQIEKMIDFHMSQLKKETENRIHVEKR